MKTRNDGPCYTTGATSRRGWVQCMNGSVRSLLFIIDVKTIPLTPGGVCEERSRKCGKNESRPQQEVEKLLAVEPDNRDLDTKSERAANESG